MKRVLTNIVAQIVTGKIEYRAKNLQEFLTQKDHCKFGSFGIVVTLKGDYLLDSKTGKIRNVISRKLNFQDSRLSPIAPNKNCTRIYKKLSLDLVTDRLFREGKIKKDSETELLKNPKIFIAGDRGQFSAIELIDISGKRSNLRIFDIFRKTR